MLWYLPTRRDEGVSADADRFDAGRPNARRHLAFGAGMDRCLGAGLARREVATVLEVLIERGLEPAAQGESGRAPSCSVHGVRRPPAILVHG